MKKRKVLTGIVCILQAVILTACQGTNSTGTETQGATEAQEDTIISSQLQMDMAEDNESYKKDIKVAVEGEAPMLDPILTTSILARDVSKYIYEGLIEMDANFEPQLQLAESATPNADYTKWTFVLREGVLFHDGTELKAEDAVASLNRWAKINGSATAIISEGIEFVEIDDYTLEIELDKPCLLFLYYLSNPSQFAGITQKSIVESADSEGGYKEFIGTGSLEFVEWRSNEYIKLKKFEDYSAPDAPLSGFSGDKTVDFETVSFYFINDAATRVAAALTNEYDIINSINYDNLNQFDGADNVQLVEGRYSIGGLVFIKKAGSKSLSEDVNFRKAINAIIDLDQITAAQVPVPDYYSLSSSYMAPFQTAWFSEVGNDRYNQQDAELAQQYLDESSYDGQAIRMITTQEYPDMYNGSLVIQKQLEDFGLEVSLETMDWATMLQRLNQPETLDMFVTNFGVSPIPNTLLFISPTRTGFTNNPELQNVIDQINAASSIDEAKALWEEGQDICWDDAEFIPLGHRQDASAITSEVINYTPFMGISLWGLKINE